MLVGGADELGAVLIRAEGGEVVLSSSSMTHAFTVAAEEENSESSREGVRCNTVLLGGVESNLKRLEKPSS